MKTLREMMDIIEASEQEVSEGSEWKSRNQYKQDMDIAYREYLIKNKAGIGDKNILSRQEFAKSQSNKKKLDKVEETEDPIKKVEELFKDR